MRIAKIVVLELLLILGSVLIYRSALTILDKFIKAGDVELWTGFIVGITMTAICLYLLDRVALKK
jgi:hypothetical protein